jgi:hypothetical protein
MHANAIFKSGDRVKISINMRKKPTVIFSFFVTRALLYYYHYIGQVDDNGHVNGINHAEVMLTFKLV